MFYCEWSVDGKIRSWHTIYRTHSFFCFNFIRPLNFAWCIFKRTNSGNHAEHKMEEKRRICALMTAFVKYIWMHLLDSRQHAIHINLTMIKLDSVLLVLVFIFLSPDWLLILDKLYEHLQCIIFKELTVNRWFMIKWCIVEVKVPILRKMKLVRKYIVEHEIVKHKRHLDKLELGKSFNFSLQESKNLIAKNKNNWAVLSPLLL